MPPLRTRLPRRPFLATLPWGLALLACGAPGSADAPRPVEGTPPVLRVAAEWEPAVGVLVHWPPYVPRALYEELARDTHLHVLVGDDAAEADARTWFARWGIDPGRVTFLRVPASDDAAWPRDFGPHPVFGEDGVLRLGDARYDRSTPDSGLACDAPLETPWNGGWGGRFADYDVRQEDRAPTAIAGELGLEALDLPFVLTGGNFLTDGRGGALSTCILVNENRDNGLPEAAFRERTRTHLGLERHAILPNFEDDGIQHVDCLLKLLDDERLLVARPPRDHALFERYERIVTEHLADLRAPSGRPYEILRLDTARYDGERLAAYTNSLILNDVVYVPLFDVPQDEVALAQWQAALPGHRVRGVRFVLDEEPALPARARRMYPGRLGWRDFDALHCRTRAVWDPGMLHVAVDRVPPAPAPAESYPVSAAITAYSGRPLLADRLAVRWRRAGDATWSTVRLERGADARFHARVPAGPAPGTVEYYLVAADASGREETAPRTAPDAVFRFRPGAR